MNQIPTMASGRPRTVVQMLTAHSGAGYTVFIVALCDDGTIWSKNINDKNTHWIQQN